MSNYEDFELDLKKITNKDSDIALSATNEYTCTKIADDIIKMVVKTYRDCITYPVPSIDYQHRSCRGPLNDRTIQVNC
jgi:hypothetical protein